VPAMDALIHIVEIHRHRSPRELKREIIHAFEAFCQGVPV